MPYPRWGATSRRLDMPTCRHKAEGALDTTAAMVHHFACMTSSQRVRPYSLKTGAAYCARFNTHRGLNDNLPLSASVESWLLCFRPGTEIFNCSFTENSIYIMWTDRLQDFVQECVSCTKLEYDMLSVTMKGVFLIWRVEPQPTLAS